MKYLFLNLKKNLHFSYIL